MKITNVIKNGMSTVGKVLTPEVIKKGAMIGGAIMFVVNAANAANERKAMEQNVLDSVLKKLREDGTLNQNGES